MFICLFFFVGGGHGGCMLFVCLFDWKGVGVGDEYVCFFSLVLVNMLEAFVVSRYFLRILWFV